MLRHECVWSFCFRAILSQMFSVFLQISSREQKLDAVSLNRFSRRFLSLADTTKKFNFAAQFYSQKMKQSVFGSKRGSLIQQKTKFCPFFEFCLDHKLLIKPFLVNPKRLFRFIIKLVLKAKKSCYMLTCNFPTSEILE